MDDHTTTSRLDVFFPPATNPWSPTVAPVYPASHTPTAGHPLTPVLGAGYAPTPAALATYPPTPATTSHDNLADVAGHDVLAHNSGWRTAIIVLLVLLITVTIVLILWALLPLVVS